MNKCSLNKSLNCCFNLKSITIENNEFIIETYGIFIRILIQ